MKFLVKKQPVLFLAILGFSRKFYAYFNKMSKIFNMWVIF